MKKFNIPVTVNKFSVRTAVKIHAKTEVWKDISDAVVCDGRTRTLYYHSCGHMIKESEDMIDPGEEWRWKETLRFWRSDKEKGCRHNIASLYPGTYAIPNFRTSFAKAFQTNVIILGKVKILPVRTLKGEWTETINDFCPFCQWKRK